MVRPSFVVLTGALLVTACSTTTSNSLTSATPSPTASSTTATELSSTTVAATSAPTTAPPPTTIALPTELEFVDGKLLGIGQGTPMSFVVDVLGITPVPIDHSDPSTTFACDGAPNVWVIQTGGWTLVVEGFSAEEAIVSNWMYVGGPAAGYSEIVAPGGIRVGDSRAALEAANPGFSDMGGEIWNYTAGVFLRYGVESGNVDWFGVIDCLFEGE